MKFIQKIKKSILIAAFTIMLLSGNIETMRVYAAVTVTSTPVATEEKKDIKVTDDAIISKEFQTELTQSFGEELAKFISNLAISMTLILKFLYALLIPLLVLIGKFLSNDWVTGNTLNVDVMIEVAWGYVRNLVNISMMFYLLYIAGANILLGYGGKVNSEAQIKQMLPKIAIALILVNFSMLFCRTIINVAGVVTTGAFGIVQQSGQLFDEKSAGYSPFIWAENLGTNAKAVDKGGQDGKTGVSVDSSKLTGTYALECVHKNYAISFKSFSLNGKGGNMLIPNPIITQDGNYGKAWYHDYRIQVTDKQRIKKDNFDNIDEWNEKVNQVRAQANPGTEGYVSSPEELEKAIGAGTSSNKKLYPYYSDCITNWNDVFFSSRTAMFMFAFNLMKISEYENGLGNIASFSDLLSRVMISLVYLVAFFFITLALTVAVVLRGVFLWFMMVMSPIWVTVELLGKGKGLGKQVGTMKSFVQLAFMPAVLGFILSVVFMMINYIKYIGVLEGADAGIIRLIGMNIYFDANNPVVGGLNSIFDMIVAIMTMIAMWFAVKMAFDFGFKDGGFLEKAWGGSGGKILNIARDIGKDVATMPLHARFIPLGKGRTTSLAALGQTPQALKDSVSNSRQQEIMASRRALMDAIGMPETGQKISADTHTKLASAVANLNNVSEFQAKVRPAISADVEKMEGKKAVFDLYDKVKAHTPNTNAKIKWEVGGKEYEISAAAADGLKTKITTNSQITSLVSQIDKAKSDLVNGKYTSPELTSTLPVLQNALFGVEAAAGAATFTLENSNKKIKVGSNEITFNPTTHATGAGMSAVTDFEKLFEKAKTLSTSTAPNFAEWAALGTSIKSIRDALQAKGVNVDDFYTFMQNKGVDFTKAHNTTAGGVPQTLKQLIQ